MSCCTAEEGEKETTGGCRRGEGEALAVPARSGASEALLNERSPFFAAFMPLGEDGTLCSVATLLRGALEPDQHSFARSYHSCCHVLVTVKCSRVSENTWAMEQYDNLLWWRVTSLRLFQVVIFYFWLLLVTSGYFLLLRYFNFRLCDR
jgi:hypothetical protein